MPVYFKTLETKATINFRRKKYLRSSLARARVRVSMVRPQDKQVITHYGPPTILTIDPFTRRFTTISGHLTSPDPRYFAFPCPPLSPALLTLQFSITVMQLEIHFVQPVSQIALQFNVVGTLTHCFTFSISARPFI